MDETEQLAAAILSYGHAREAHFDPEVATDGPFTILLTLYNLRSEISGVSVEMAIEAVDDRMSAAIFALERLIASGYVESIGNSDQRRFRLSIKAERQVAGYLAECLAMHTIVRSRFAAY